AARYFVPFYRATGEISAYTHLEKRFGSWARTYAVVCFLLTQLARIGSIFFGIALTLQALTGFSMEMIMLVTGVSIIIYTVLGGIEAVIWTEVVQGVIKTAGALLILYLVVSNLPGGLAKVHPELIEAVKLKVAAEKLPLTATAAQLTQAAAQLQPADYGDKLGHECFGDCVRGRHLRAVFPAWPRYAPDHENIAYRHRGGGPAGHGHRHRHDRREKRARCVVGTIGHLRGGHAGLIPAGRGKSPDPQPRSPAGHDDRRARHSLDDVL
nr:hypothetical protein [Tanacetum cinerariifolium]